MAFDWNALAPWLCVTAFRRLCSDQRALQCSDIGMHVGQRNRKQRTVPMYNYCTISSLPYSRLGQKNLQ